VKSVNHYKFLGCALAAVLMLGISAPVQAQQTESRELQDLVLKGDAKCTRCHDDEDSPGVITIGRTKHGTRADARTPTCTSCHGDSEDHLSAPVSAENRPKPDRYFSKGTSTPASVRADACLTCHKGNERMFWNTSTHSARDVSCNSCHKIHNGGVDEVRDRSTQPEVCFDCHKGQRVQFQKASRHPIVEGKVVCSDCHSPHGSAGPKLMARDTVNDTCFQCHVEKRGPFLWNHQPVTEDCSYCHNPHGTNTAMLLKWRQPFLCQQCHEPSSHQGEIASLTSSGGAPRTLARGCLNCHTNIHGGNHPIDGSASRSFRR